MKIRDIIAIPFWVIATICDGIAVRIGGVWTARMYQEGVIRQYEQLNK
jgi:hypothetical protein